MKITSTLPVSRKFLSRMNARVSEIMSQIGTTTDTSADDVLAIIMHYLLTSEIPAIKSGPASISAIIFFTLKSEIEAAILRSQRARARALQRKSTTSHSATPAVSGKSDSTITSAPSDSTQPSSPASPQQPPLYPHFTPAPIHTPKWIKSKRRNGRIPHPRS